MGSAEDQPTGDGDPDPSATCFGRRFILDPAAHTIVDVSGQQVNKVVGLGIAGVEGALAFPGAAVDLGRKIVGAETRPPEPVASETSPLD
jgi:hypothetical protein